MFRPAIKKVHRPLVLPGRRIQLGLLQYGVASEIVDDEDGTLERVLELMDGTRDVAGIWSELRSTHPGWDIGDVRDVIDQLAEAGHVEDAGAPLPPGLSRADAERYRSCRDFFAWIDDSPRSSPYEIQARIRNAEVAVLGLGGTGTSVAASLVASGVGRVRCADFDRVEETNLTRQLIYSEADVGRRKVDAAVARLRALNSTVTVIGLDLRIGSAEDVARVIDGCDAFVLCADEPADLIQSWANTAALRSSTPWFMAAYTGATTGVGGFVPGLTGCWECLQNGPENRGRVQPGERYLFDDLPHAVVAASAAVAGHLCALEVLYRIGGLPPQAEGKIFQLNLARWDHHYFLEAVRDPACRACGDRS